MDDDEYRTAALVFAHYIGIDLDHEPELIVHAEDALRDLPADWELGIGEGDNQGIPFFFNTKTSKSVWVHPLESKYRRIVEDERKKLLQRRSDKHGPDRDSADRSSNRARHDKDNNWNKFQSSRHDADITEIEDFDFEPSTRERTEQISKPPATSANNSKGKEAADPSRFKFGMSSDDFFDNDPEDEKPKSYPRADRNDRPATESASTRGKEEDYGKNRDEAQATKALGTEKVGFKPIFSKNWLDEDSRPEKEDKGKVDRDDKHKPSERPLSRGGGDEHDGKRGVAFVGAVDKDKKEKSAEGDRPRSSGGADRLPSRQDSGDRDYRRSESREERDRDRSYRDGSSRGRSPGSRDDKTDDRDRSRDRGGGSDRDRGDSRGRSSDREKRRDGSYGDGRETFSSSRYIEDENRRLKEEISGLKDELDRERRKAADMSAEKDSALDRLRREMNRTDAELAVKVAELHRLQEEVDSCDIRAKRQADVAVEDAHVKHREAIRLLKIELEDEWRARLEAVKKRSEEEANDLRREIDSAKKRLDDSVAEAEEMRRKMINIREDGRGEANAVLEACRAQLRETEDKLRLQGLELKKVKEDHANLSLKASGALQSAQVSIAESEAIKAQASSAISEAHSSQAALMLATQRLQQAEAEVSRVRAENMVLMREIDATSQELKKFQAQSFIANDGMSTAEAEARRSKARLQAEINRLTTRCSELSGLNSALQSEVDLASETRDQAVREVLQQLSKAEHEQQILMLRLHDADERNERTLATLSKTDGELRAHKELLQKKERNIRELMQQRDEISSALEDERARNVIESEGSRREIKELRTKIADAERDHRLEIDAIKDDVSKKIPQISASAVAEAEKLCLRENELKLSSLRSEYEIKLEQKSRDLIRSQTAHEEAVARLKSANAEDKADVERLRFQVRRLQHRCDELEADVEDRARKGYLQTQPMLLNQHGGRNGMPVVYHHPTPLSSSHPIYAGESIDGTMFMNSVGNNSIHYAPPPPHPAQSMEFNNSYISLEEKKLMEMMQSEIKGIQDKLSRSMSMGPEQTPLPNRWTPSNGNYSGNAVNHTMPYAHSQQYYRPSDASIIESEPLNRSRDEGQIWAELLARQAKRNSKQVSSNDRVDPRMVSFAKAENVPASDSNLSNSVADNRKRSDFSSPRKPDRPLRDSTPTKSPGQVPRTAEDRAAAVAEPGYQSGYWKTKYMR